MRAGPFALIVTMALAACSVPDARDASRNVVAFHEAYNRSQFQRIDEMTSTNFRQAAEARRFSATLPPIRERLGEWRGQRMLYKGFQATSAGTVIIHRYEGTFANGRAVETFVFEDDGGATKLRGYGVSQVLTP